MKIKNFYTFLAIILYKASCDYAYGNIISLLFAYQNFKNDPTTFTQYYSWFMVLSLSPLIIKTFNKENLSSSIVSVLILVSFIPTTTLIAFDSTYKLEYLILMYVYWLIFITSNIYFPKIKLSSIGFKAYKYGYIFISIILCVTIIFVSWKFTGFRFHFGLTDVYELRTEARGYEIPLILGYLSTFSDNLLPILLVYFLYKKKYTVAIIISGVILLNFGITATKQILFLLFLAIFGFFFVKSLNVVKIYVWAFLVLIYFCIGEFLILGTYFVSIFSIYRVFFIPAKLHYVYYDFFSTRELDYFRQSVFKYFIDSPYKENIGFILGDYDIGDVTARANNGLFSDSYMNLGFIGVFIFPFIVVLILKILDGAVIGLNQRIFFIITSSISFVLLGLPFTTALFSAGILVLVFFLYSLPREKVILN